MQDQLSSTCPSSRTEFDVCPCADCKLLRDRVQVAVMALALPLDLRPISEQVLTSVLRWAIRIKQQSPDGCVELLNAEMQNVRDYASRVARRRAN